MWSLLGAWSNVARTGLIECGRLVRRQFPTDAEAVVARAVHQSHQDVLEVAAEVVLDVGDQVRTAVNCRCDRCRAM